MDRIIWQRKENITGDAGVSSTKNQGIKHKYINDVIIWNPSHPDNLLVLWTCTVTL